MEQNKNTKLDMDKKTIVSVTPTFLLKGVDPIRIYNEYVQGKYVNMCIPHNKIKLSVSSLALAPQHGTSIDSESYSYKDKTNNNQVVAMTNHIQYSIVKANDGKELPVIGKCEWCLRKIKQTPVGIPIAVTKVTRVSNNEKYTNLTFHVDGLQCRFECAYSVLKRRNASSYLYRDPLHMDSEQMLLLMYRTMHPHSGKLMEAKDWRLLKENNGTLDDDKYDEGSHHYIRTNNVVLLPAKIEYTVTPVKN